MSPCSITGKGRGIGESNHEERVAAKAIMKARSRYVGWGFKPLDPGLSPQSLRVISDACSASA